MKLKLQLLRLIISTSPIIFLTLNLSTICLSSPPPAAENPIPTRWPEQFHALLFMNFTPTGELHLADLWYDWPRGRNVNIHQNQLAKKLLFAVEWNNGTSFYYTLGNGGDGDGGTCDVTQFEVGIPRPDFLAEGAEYLGTQVTDGFLCHVWEKADFIWYYEDVLTRRPVRFDFSDGGITNHVMTFEVGAVLPDSVTQAPAYCFKQDSDA
ncbi:uncharacterized protein At4g14100 isoform X1 [Morus notabilis]|uniref:uncharacterized protein At4g14100 isoform X1 n=1 Tax=Morus notabilis TaxID=981085 RepID=UPI000CED072F|nr:uncharacterized protein At4g14100 isoform X1 [Morus notabilis]